MKKTFLNPNDKAEVLERLRRLQPDSARCWGKMTAHQAICHLSDSFKSGTGEKQNSRVDNWFSRSAMKWVALEVPLQWPRGIKTRPEMDQLIGGTPPEDFNRDRKELEAIIERFCQPGNASSFHPHPIFGLMTEAEWMRWGYLHCDHHLRQFGM
jgi:hypothetical protein